MILQRENTGSHRNKVTIAVLFIHGAGRVNTTVQLGLLVLIKNSRASIAHRV